MRFYAMSLAWGLSMTVAGSAADGPSPGEHGPPPAESVDVELPAGFRHTLFAAEPDVTNPIAMTFDGRGRLWIAENHTYADRQTRFDLSRGDRIVILDGTGGDHATSRTVFADGLVRLTGVEWTEGGVYAMCPPRLLFIPDADGDDVPDGPARTVLDGFTVAESNYHNFANGVRFGPDGWLYGRCGGSCPGRIGVPGTPDEHRLALEGGMWRYRPSDATSDSGPRVEVLTTGTTNPWGHAFNDVGELFFINTVNGHLWHAIPGMHFARPFTMDPNPRTFELVDTHADHYHFDTSGEWHQSRDGAANDFGGGHAHSGCWIVDDPRWPAEMRGDLLTLNFHGRRINRDRLARRGGGYVARHAEDLALWDDPWFRGIEMEPGPDGGLFVIDWSDTGECHEHDGVHHESGRVFKIIPPPKSTTEASPPDHAVAFDQPNEDLRCAWIRRTSDDAPIDDAMGPDWKDAAAVKACEDLFERHGDRYLAMASDDPSPRVRTTLASTLQRLPVDRRVELARRLVVHAEDADDHNLPRLIWYGLMPVLDVAPESLVEVAAASRLPTTTRLIARGMSTVVDDRPDAVDGLLRLAADDASRRDAILDGLTLGWAGRSRIPTLDGLTTLLDAAGDDVRVASIASLSGDGRAADELFAIVRGDGDADDTMRLAALRTLIDLGGADLSGVAGLRQLCLDQLKNAKLNVAAAEGLSGIDDPEVGRVLAARYRNFRAADRPALMSVLASRPSLAAAMLREVREGAIPPSAIDASTRRQLRWLNDDAVDSLTDELFGPEVTVDGDAGSRIAETRTRMLGGALAAADASGGRTLFETRCNNCHRLYGRGGGVGPDLTGAQRHDLDYLLTNILAPSAVVDQNYRMSLVQTDDGRILSGLITETTDRTTTIRDATRTTVVENDSIVATKTTDQSPMPSGLVDDLDDDQLASLLVFLGVRW